MADEHGSSVKDDKDASEKGGKASGSGTRTTNFTQGGTKAQKLAAGRKGGKASRS